jgi:hypothetical protein
MNVHPRRRENRFHHPTTVTRKKFYVIVIQYWYVQAVSFILHKFHIIVVPAKKVGWHVQK